MITDILIAVGLITVVAIAWYQYSKHKAKQAGLQYDVQTWRTDASSAVENAKASLARDLEKLRK